MASLATRADLAARQRPMLTGWPGGPRTLACLACGSTFRSRGKAERLCVACRRESEEPIRGGVRIR